MASTDRQRIKDQQEGEYTTTAGMTDAPAAVKAIHSRTRECFKVGTENAATNVGETVGVGNVVRKSRLNGLVIAAAANVATDNADYDVITFYKRTSGTSTSLGTWNTHSSAQGALTTNVSSAVTISTNSDAVIAAGSQLNYKIDKYGSGKAVTAGTIFSFDLEEI